MARGGPRIGAHVSVASRGTPASKGVARGRGLLRAVPRAQAIGAETIQVFAANPRGWASPAPDPAGDEAFRIACAEAGIPVFVHAPYLINFGSPAPDTLAKSARALGFSLRRAAAIGALGVVVHAGSAVRSTWGEAMARVRAQLLPLLDDAPAGPRVLIEPTAGGGGSLAGNASSLAAYLDALGGDERIGVCLDTCHMHAAGHDLSSGAGFAAALRSYARAIGRTQLALVHVNDSRDPAGSTRDRHASLGAGSIGREPFAALFRSQLTRSLPLVVETAEANHAADIATLKALRAERRAPRSG